MEIPQELINLFTDEAGTRLARLSEQLLQLEEPSSEETRAALVDSVFRDAHSLKGSAGMMGFTSFAQVAHQIEDVLHGVRDGTRTPTPPMIDALLAAVNGLRSHLATVVAGNPDEVALANLEVRLRAAVEGAGPASADQASTTEPVPTVAEGPDDSAGLPLAGLATADDGIARVPLTRIDSIVRLASEASAAHTRLVAALQERLGPGEATPAEVHRLGAVVRELEARSNEARMVPLATVTEPLRRAAREIARAQGKAIRFEVEGEEVELDRAVLNRLGDALLHLVRNAVDHGVEAPVERVQAGKKAQALVRVSAHQRGRDVVVAVHDDGRGIDLDRIRRAADDETLSDEAAMERLFQPGFSTASEVTSVSGRGVGLDVVRAALAPVRGRVDVRTTKGKGTTFLLDVPLTIAAVPSLVVRCDGRQYALALSAVAATRSPEPGDVPLGAVLQVPTIDPTATVVLKGDDRDGGFSVDEIVAQRDVVVKAVGTLPAIPLIAGAAIDTDGTVLVVLDAAAVVATAPVATTALPPPPPPDRSPRVLVVDDDAVVREMQRSMLARAGYEVRTAEHGAAALATLRDWPADLALVDVQMPVMDGLEFTEALRRDPVLRGTAVMMLTSLGSDADRRRGMEAGADGFLVKGTFAADAFLAAVARLLGRETP